MSQQATDADATFFTSNATDLKIYYQHWPISPGKGVLGSVFLVHGFGEHSGRYWPLVSTLLAAGFTVTTLDHNAHGRSEGTARAQLRGGWQALVADVIQLATDVAPPSAAGATRRFLVGHSMGGLVAALCAIQAPELWAGAVLTAPALGVPPSCLLVEPMPTILRCVASCQPGAPVAEALPIEGLCSDEAVRRAYEADPLVHRGPVPMATGIAIVDGGTAAQRGAPSLTMPLLIAISEIDT